MEEVLASAINAKFYFRYFYVEDKKYWLRRNGFIKDYDTYDKDDLNYYYSPEFDVVWREPKEGKRKIHD